MTSAGEVSSDSYTFCFASHNGLVHCVGRSVEFKHIMAGSYCNGCGLDRGTTAGRLEGGVKSEAFEVVGPDTQ